MTHVRAVVWGPAEFVGFPPWRLVGKGLLAGTLGVAFIVGSTVVGAWYGLPVLARGEAALVGVGALCLYLGLVRAGRALIGMVAVLGVCLALQAPQAATGVVPAERGRVEAGVVTLDEGGPAAVVHDPNGRVPSRGVAADATAGGALPGLGGRAAALVAGCVVAVVRSHRLTHTTAVPVRDADASPP